MPDKTRYEDDLRRRLAEAKAFIGVHQGKVIGPYKLTVTIHSLHYGEVIDRVLELLRDLERGPDVDHGQMGGSDEYNDAYQWFLTTDKAEAPE